MEALSHQIHNNSAITTVDIKILHEQMLSNGNSNVHKTLELVSIMGGIDAILSHYLSTTASLTTQQLQQIHAIMSSKNEIQHYTPKETIDLEDTSSNELVLSFDVNDTYLHLLFGSHYGSMITSRVVYKKRCLYTMFL
eukprot:1085588_1